MSYETPDWSQQSENITRASIIELQILELSLLGELFISVDIMESLEGEVMVVHFSWKRL